jgi:hypothetical protein
MINVVPTGCSDRVGDRISSADRTRRAVRFEQTAGLVDGCFGGKALPKCLQCLCGIDTRRPLCSASKPSNGGVTVSLPHKRPLR